MSKFRKGAIVILTTATLTTGALGVKTIGDLKETNALQEELLKNVKGELHVTQSRLKEREDAVASLQETNLQITSEFDAMLNDFTNLKKNYDTNLIALNNAKKELAQKQVNAVKTDSYNRKTASVPKEYAGWSRMIVESTAYTNYENGDRLAGRKWGNLTASGKPTRYGCIAVDPKVIPLGTEVYIPALQKVFVAMDTGNAIKGRKIDIFFNTMQECVQWGRKYNLEIYVKYK